MISMRIYSIDLNCMHLDDPDEDSVMDGRNLQEWLNPPYSSHNHKVEQ